MTQTAANPRSKAAQPKADPSKPAKQVESKPSILHLEKFVFDLGNRDIKCGFNEKVFQFRSYQALRPARQDFDFMPENSWLIKQGAFEWVVGAIAQNLAIPTYLGNKWEHAKPLLYGAIAKAGLKGDVVIDKLRVSTPDKQSVEQTDRLSALKGTHSFAWNENSVSLVISEVQIVDEGVSAWLNANRLGLWRYPHYLNAVLDAGGGTTIGRIICPNTGVIRQAEFVIDGGTSRLASQIESDLRMANMTSTILDCIERGNLVLPSGLDFSNAFERAKMQWQSEVKAEIKNRWRPYQDRMAQVLIVGGSAPLFKDWLGEGSRYLIPERPQTFGVEGLLYA